MAIASVKSQYYPVKLIVIDNTELRHTIGKCWNEAAKMADTKWVLLLGDDDWLSKDYTYCLHKFAEEHPDFDNISTGFIHFNDMNQIQHKLQQVTGLFNREYLLKYPFNEKLERGVDREYVEEAQKRGIRSAHLMYHQGCFVRMDSVHSLTKRPDFVQEGEEPEIYVNSRYSTFIQPVVNKLKYQGYDVALESKAFDPLLVKNAKLIWVDWCDSNAHDVAEYKVDIPKILRVHAYEAFTLIPQYLDFDAFKQVIFVAPHIREYIEHAIRKPITHARVIPNGVQLDKFSIAKDKKRNNKVAWAGFVDRKKGAGELMMIAKHFPDYQFHVACRFNEQDTLEYYRQMAPDNMVIEPYAYKLNEFFKDKTYYLNTSIREGCPITPLEAMAAGLKPIIRHWYGAVDYLPEYWLWETMDDIKKILEGEYDPERYREVVRTRYNFDDMYKEFKGIIDDELNASTTKNKVQDTHTCGISIG
jgi:glycosyltransferase involved in cell wall biosynthesis